jgi:hypothetical protein
MRDNLNIRVKRRETKLPPHELRGPLSFLYHPESLPNCPQQLLLDGKALAIVKD